MGIDSDDYWFGQLNDLSAADRSPVASSCCGLVPLLSDGKLYPPVFGLLNAFLMYMKAGFLRWMEW